MRQARQADVTLAIPTWNGGAQFRELLARLAEAEPRPSRVLVHDSESRDGTPEAARAAGCEVVPIARADFDHGATRQAMAMAATTSFVAFLSQDALPERDWLAPLVTAMDDPRLAAATSRILPRPSASPLARRTVLATPGAGDEPLQFELEPGETVASIAPRRLRELCRLDDVASLIRRDVLLALPFPRTMMGEDAAFARKALAAGHRLRFVPDSVVYHSHEYGPASAFLRYREDARFVAREYGLMLRPTLFSVLRGIAHEVREDWRFLCGERPAGGLVAAFASPLLRSGQILGQWRGSVGAARR
jgi:rhamnosyltransferase